MFRHPPRRTTDQIQASIAATEQRIAALEEAGYFIDAANYRQMLRLVLLPELARAEKRSLTPSGT